jgi:transcriptional regulator with XRE-family HTH domain
MSSQEFVRRARRTLDLSQTEFGAKLGLTRQTVWRYETIDPLPRPTRLAIEQLLSMHRAEQPRKRKAS